MSRCDPFSLDGTLSPTLRTGCRFLSRAHDLAETVAQEVRPMNENMNPLDDLTSCLKEIEDLDDAGREVFREDFWAFAEARERERATALAPCDQ